MVTRFAVTFIFPITEKQTETVSPGVNSPERKRGNSPERKRGNSLSMRNSMAIGLPSVISFPFDAKSAKRNYSGGW
jgi:hypothetical protein